jgi:hypothetical protein
LAERAAKWCSHALLLVHDLSHGNGGPNNMHKWRSHAPWLAHGFSHGERKNSRVQKREPLNGNSGAAVSAFLGIVGAFQDRTMPKKSRNRQLILQWSGDPRRGFAFRRGAINRASTKGKNEAQGHAQIN